MSAEQELNDRAYRHLKDSIDASYPPGQFVALVRGRVIADADSFSELLAKLDRVQADPRRSFVIQAGEEYPEYEIIRRLPGS